MTWLKEVGKASDAAAARQEESQQRHTLTGFTSRPSAGPISMKEGGLDCPSAPLSGKQNAQ